MACHVPGCLGNYDFEHIANFAIKRFVDGINTVSLLKSAKSEREREEIALVSFLDIEDNKIRDLKLCCQHSSKCEALDCRQRLIKIISERSACNAAR